MANFVERLVRTAGGKLALINLALVVLLKVVLPVGGLGLATISDQLRPIDPITVIEQTNAARAGASVGRLTHNLVLDQAAQAKLDDMERLGYFAHVGPEGEQAWDFIARSGYTYRAAGENLARGFTVADDVVGAWMRSPTHRANMLNAAYQDIGVAVRPVIVNGVSALVVVEFFGTPRSVAVAPPAVRTANPQKDAPQYVSTDRRIPPVSVPIREPVVRGAAVTDAIPSLSSALALYLTALCAVVLLCGIVVQRHRSWAWALGVNGLALMLVVLVPVLPTAVGLIF